MQGDNVRMRIRSGLLLGVWLAANIAAYRLLVSSGWPTGGDTPINKRLDVFNLLPSWAPAAIIALAFVAPVLFVAAWRYLERLTGIDQAAVSSISRWCRRALTRPASIGVILGVVTLLTLPAIDEIFWPAAVAAIAFVLLLPLGVFSAAVAASPIGDGWWRLRWPGARPIGAVLLLLALVYATEAGLTAVSDRLPAVAALTTLLAIAVGLAAVALEGAILLFGLTPAEAIRHARQMLTWQRLGPVIAVHARVLLLSLFVLTPVALGALVLWKVIPFHASWAADRGVELPWSARMLATIGAAFDMSGVYMSAFVLGLPLLMMVSRVLWQTREPSPEPGA